QSSEKRVSSRYCITAGPQQFALIPDSGLLMRKLRKSVSIMVVLDRSQHQCHTRNRLSSDTTPMDGVMATSLSRATSGRAFAASFPSTALGIASSSGFLQQTRGRLHDPRTGGGDDY